MHTFLVLLTLTLVAPACAGLSLPSIFRDGMVLQTPENGGTKTLIFGYAAPGEEVEVNMTIPGRSLVTYQTYADAVSGKWSVAVAPSPADLTPDGVSFSIVSKSDLQPIVISNATFGEVILCNGQVRLLFCLSVSPLHDFLPIF